MAKKNKKAPYVASDEQTVEERQVEQELQRKQELHDIKALLDLPAGVRFFRRMVVDSKMFSTTFTGNSQSYFLEGRRSLALQYFGDIAEADSNKIAELIVLNQEESE